MNDLAERIAAFVEEQGHAVKIERYGENDRWADLGFRSTGKIYHVRIDTTDDAYFALSIGYSLDEPVTRDVLLKAAAETMAAIKAAKIDVGERSFEASVEQFFGQADGYQPIFWRCLNVATQAASDFMSRVDVAREASGAGDAQAAADKFVAEFLHKPEHDAE